MSYIFWALISCLFLYVVLKQNKKGNVPERFTIEEKKEICNKIRECNKKAMDEARIKHPIGKALIGQNIILRKEVDIRLNSDSELMEGSYKIPAVKLSSGEEIQFLGIDSDNYIVKTKDIKKGYLHFDNKEIDQRIDEQLELCSKLYDMKLKEIADEYKLSDEELLSLKNLAI